MHKASFRPDRFTWDTCGADGACHHARESACFFSRNTTGRVVDTHKAGMSPNSGLTRSTWRRLPPPSSRPEVSNNCGEKHTYRATSLFIHTAVFESGGEACAWKLFSPSFCWPSRYSYKKEKSAARLKSAVLATSQRVANNVVCFE